MPSPRQARRTPANTRGKGDLGGQGKRSGRQLPSPWEHGKTGNKKLFKKRENKNEGGVTPLTSVSVRDSVTLSEGRARRHGNSANMDFNKTRRHIITDIRHGENQGLRILGSNEEN